MLLIVFRFLSVFNTTSQTDSMVLSFTENKEIAAIDTKKKKKNLLLSSCAAGFYGLIILNTSLPGGFLDSAVQPLDVSLIWRSCGVCASENRLWKLQMSLL